VLLSNGLMIWYILFPLAIVLHVLLRIMVSDYPFGIFKLFVHDKRSILHILDSYLAYLVTARIYHIIKPLESKSIIQIHILSVCSC
jgi:hypothetical protein